MNIKFRGWHVKKKLMFSPEEMAKDQLTLLPTGNFINVNSAHVNLSTIFPSDEFIPLQFTGRYDIKGNEIYLGDILENIHGDILEVVWSEHSCAFVLKHQELEFELPINDKCVIIGNIYECCKI